MNILLVKLSSLGDVVHTLPVVQDLLAALPGAHIDWVVERPFAPLLGACPGVRRVITCELRRWRKSPWSAATREAWRAFRADLQSHSYDAVIDLQGLSKSALVSALARLAPGGKRYAMAHGTEGSGYEAPTRWVADVPVALPRHVHAVHRGRLLCARAMGYTPAELPDFGLGTATPQAGTVLLVHGTSRADKEWPQGHWLQLGQRLLEAGHSLALAHGSDAELATSQALAQAWGQGGQVTVWPRLPLDELLRAMAGCAGVVGVDSGLSHMAVALDLPHVQLYNFDTAWRTGPPAAGESGARPWQRSLYAQPAPAADAAWAAWQACWAARAQATA